MCWSLLPECSPMVGRAIVEQFVDSAAVWSLLVQEKHKQLLVVLQAGIERREFLGLDAAY